MKITKAENGPKPLEPKVVQVRVALVKDLIKAEQIAGKAQGYDFLCGVVSQCCEFDGQKLPPEEVELLSMTDFLELTDELGLNGKVISPDTSSTLSEKGNSESHLSLECHSQNLPTGSSELTATSGS